MAAKKVTDEAVKETVEKAAEETKATKKKSQAKTSTKKATTKKDTAKVEEAKEPEEIEVEEDEIPVEEFDEADDILADLMKLMAYRGHKGLSASERKEVYGNGIVADDAFFHTKENRAMTQEDWIQDEYKELSLASNPKRKSIKIVRVIGIEGDSVDELRLVCRLRNKDKVVDSHRGEFKIVIPSYELTDWNPEDFKSARGAVDFERDLERWIGCDLQVVIFQVNEKERIASASRLSAAELLSYKYFKAKRKNGQPQYTEGMILTGTVMTTRKDRLVVSVNGQDIKIKSEEASWTPQLPLDNEFKKGQKVNVKILEIDNSYTRQVGKYTYKLSKLKGSIKQAQINPNKAHFDYYKLYQKYIARVKGETPDGTKVFCTLEPHNVSCLADASLIGKVSVGEECMVMITRIDEKECKLWGQVVNPNI